MLAQALDHIFDVVVGDRHLGGLELELAEIAQLDFRIDLEGRPVREMGIVGRGQRLDCRPARGVHLLLGHSVREARANDFAEDFLAHLAAVALPDDFGRHLAGPETLEPGRLAHLLEPEIDLAIDLRIWHADRYLTLQPLG